MQFVALARFSPALIGIYATIAALPSITHRYEDTQMLATGIAAALLIVAAGLVLFRHPIRSPRLTLLHATVVAYCVLALVSFMIGGEGYQPWLILSKYAVLLAVFGSTAMLFRQEEFPMLCHCVSALLVLLGFWALLLDSGLVQLGPNLQPSKLLKLHFGHQNALACFVVMALPFSIRNLLTTRGLLRILALASLASAAWLVFRSGSRNGVGTVVVTSVATVAAIQLHLRTLRLRTLMVTFCVTALFVLLALTFSQGLRTKFWWTVTGNTPDREFLWKTSASVIRESPAHILIGHGPGILYPRVYQADYANMGAPKRYPDYNAHNEYLEILMETGLIGLLFCGATGILIGRQAIRARNGNEAHADGMLTITCSLIAFSQFGFFSVVTRGVIIQLWLAILLGMAAAWMPRRWPWSHWFLLAITVALIPSLLRIHQNFRATRHLLTAQIQTDEYGKPGPGATAQAVQIDPGNVDGRFMSLMVHAQDGNLDASRIDIEAIRKILPRYKESEVIYAHALGFNKPGEAAQHLKHHLEVNRFAWSTRMDLAMYCFAAGDRSGLENAMIDHFKALARWYEIKGVTLKVHSSTRNGMQFLEFRRPGDREIALHVAEIPGLLWGRNPRSLDDSRRLIEANTQRFLMEHMKIGFTPWTK